MRRLMLNFLVEKKPTLADRRYSFHLHDKTLSFVEIKKVTNKLPEIMASESRHYDSLESLPELISYFTEDKKLNTPSYWLLTPEDYELFLIDSLPVESTEIKEALQWRVRSLISYPVEEAVIDYFKLPEKRGASAQMLGVVVARKSYIDTVSRTFKEAGIELAAIDVPELAMRNLTALYEDDEKSTAFIYFYPGTVILNITRQKTLFFTRRIKLKSLDEPAPEDYKQLGLEITRYFDYYQTQWRHPPPNRVFVSSDGFDSEIIASKLSESLLTTVEAFTLNALHEQPDTYKTIEKEYLLTLGCALREEASSAKTRN